MDNTQKPFSMQYVLRTTAKHMHKSIEISIKKTLSRVEEFSDNREKSAEVLRTLSFLYGMQKQLDTFQEDNSESFK